MELISLGSTKLQVSKIGLGMAALGRPGYINIGHQEDLKNGRSIEAMQQQAALVLDFAWKQGIRYFDTARSYGKGEEFLAYWSQNRQTKNIVIGSKWGYTYTANWQVTTEHHEIKEHSLAKLNEQYAESKSLLSSSLNLYQIHSATLESNVLENKEVLNQLQHIKQDGIHIGLSVSGERQAEIIEKAIAVKVDGQRLFDTVQATFNMFEQSAKDSLIAAKQAGMGVIIKEALANGRLTNRNTIHGDHRNMQLLKHTATTMNTTIDALAMAFVSQASFVDVVLSGVASVEHLASNLKCLDINLDKGMIQEFNSLKEPATIYWQKRKQLSWN